MQPRGPLSKKEAINHVRSGEICILCATEVVGMLCTLHSCVRRPYHTLLQGTDLLYVGDVVQFQS